MQDLQIIQYLRIFWHRKWFILLAVVVAGGSAFASTRVGASTSTPTTPTSYEARTTIVSNLSTGASNAQLADVLSGALADRSIQTQIRLMRSRNVLQRAAAMLYEGSEPPSPDLLSALADSLGTVITIQPVAGTNLLEIRASASSPELARRRADALANAYIEYIKAAQTQAIEDSLQATRASLEVAREALPELAGQAADSLASLDRQVGFVLSLLDDEALALDSLATGPAAGQTSASIRSLLSAELPSHIESIGVLVAGLAHVRGMLSTGGETDAANSLSYVHAELTAVRNSLNALLSSAASGGLSDSQVRSDLAAAALNLDIAHRQLQATVSLGGLPPVPFGELSALVQVAASTRTGVSALSTQVTSRTNGTASSSIVAARYILALELLEGIATRVEAMQTEPDLVTPVALADIEGRTRAANGAIAELRGALEDLRSSNPPTGDTARLVVAIEHLRRSETRLTEAANAFSGIGSGTDPRIEELTRLERDLERLLLSPTETGVRVVDSAGAVPVSAGVVARTLGSEVRVALALVAGLLVGLIGSLGIEYGDKSVRNLERLRTRTRLRALGLAPRAPRVQAGVPRSANGASFELYDEALHAVATNLEEQCVGKPGLLLVASPQAHAGATTTAFNLARLFSRRKRRTLLIDANVRKPDLTGTLGLQQQPGLAAVLDGRSEFAKCVVDVGDLQVLPAGTTDMGAVELLSSPALRSLLQAAEESFDVIIVDSAPLLGFAETMVLAREVGQALVVTDARRTTLSSADEAAERLEGVGVRVLGALVSGVRPRDFGHLRARGYRTNSGEAPPDPGTTSTGGHRLAAVRSKASRVLAAPASSTTTLK